MLIRYQSVIALLALAPLLFLTAAAPIPVLGPPSCPCPVVADARLIECVECLPASESLDRVLKLKGVTFRYTDEAVALSKGSLGFKFGFVAQDAECVFPAWVECDKDGFKTVSEQGVAALLVEAIRGLRNEQQARVGEEGVLTTRVGESETVIAKLERRLDELDREVERLKERVRTLEGHHP